MQWLCVFWLQFVLQVPSGPAAACGASATITAHVTRRQEAAMSPCRWPTPTTLYTEVCVHTETNTHRQTHTLTPSTVSSSTAGLCLAKQIFSSWRRAAEDKEALGEQPYLAEWVLHYHLTFDPLSIHPLTRCWSPVGGSLGFSLGFPVEPNQSLVIWWRDFESEIRYWSWGKLCLEQRSSKQHDSIHNAK